MANDCFLKFVVHLNKGAFLLGMNDAAFMNEQQIRIKYFLSHQSGFATLAKHAEKADTNHSVLLTLVRLLHRIVGGDTPSGVDWAEQNFTALCFNRIRLILCERFNGMASSEKMEWLVGLRMKLQSTSLSKLLDLLSQLNEIIVLTENAAKVEEGVFAKDLSQMVTEWVYNASVIGAAIQTQPRDDGAKQFSPIDDSLAFATMDAIAPQIRRRLTDAMLHHSSVVNKSDVHKLAPSFLFSIMQDRVVVSREECFDAFVKEFKGDSSLDDLCSAFAFGMHQLSFCGLVSEKLGSKNNVLYERTTLVWCSGN